MGTPDLSLRLVSSRAPYRRAGVNFDPTGSRSFGVTIIPFDSVTVEKLDELFRDPHIDVMLGGIAEGWFVIDSIEDVDLVMDRLLPWSLVGAYGRGTESVLQDFASQDAELTADDVANMMRALANLGAARVASQPAETEAEPAAEVPATEPAEEAPAAEDPAAEAVVEPAADAGRAPKKAAKAK